MGIVVIGTSFVDVKGFPEETYIPNGCNAGRVEYVHGGAARNLAEDIANMGLRPVFISSVDESLMGRAVVEQLARHKVNVDNVITAPDGMGSWLALFDGNGEVASSVSRRPDTYTLLRVLEEVGDEVIADCDSIILELDLHKEVVKKIFELAEHYDKKVYALVSNMSIAAERRDFFQKLDCFICNQQEAGILFLDDYTEKTPEEMCDILAERIKSANISAMIVTLGEKGAVYANQTGIRGLIPAKKVAVKDTTGAGDAFCAGAMAGLTYGKSLAESVHIGTTLAASVITSYDNVCPGFSPEEFGFQRMVLKPYAFVDGSYNSRTKVYGYGGFLVDRGKKYVLQGSGREPEMASMHNVAGEILGCMAAVEQALKLGLDTLDVYYDYMGIEMWATGGWKRNKSGTIAYYEYMQSVKDKIRVSFIKVKGHSGIEGNEEADKLAKEAVGIKGER